MSIVVGYESALAYWRLVGPGFLGDSKARRKATQRARAVMESDRKPRLEGGNRRPAGCAIPVHVLVGNAASRVRSESVTSSIWGALPEKSIIEGGTDFLMSSPEFCFLQLASKMSLNELILLSFELCGTYCLVDGAPAKRRTMPLTSITALRTFAEAVPRAPGRAKALRALRYGMDGSASPMETVLAMLLCLPHALGGYGLERPKLNYRIDVSPSMRKLADRAYCECDLCWPEAALCVEYDSRLYHTDPERQESDARRRNTLASLDFTVVTVSRGQVMNGAAFNRLAHQLAKKLGKRLRYKDPDFTRRYCSLRDELIASMRASFDYVK